jgi:serine/alanine adding enzyme
MVSLSDWPCIPADGRKAHIEDWARYAEASTSATVYHLPEWSEVLEESFGFRPFHVFARNDDGSLSGVLPLFLVRSVITGSRLVSLPFSYSCGPIGDSQEVVAAMIDRARNLSDSLKCNYLEIKTVPGVHEPWWGNNGFKACDQFSTFVLRLCGSDGVWRKLDPKSVRWAVGKARRDGVTVTKAKTDADLMAFHRLNLGTKRRIGVPGHPSSLFRNIFDRMPDRSSLYLAQSNDVTVGGLLTVKYKGVVLAGYAASDDKYRRSQPNSLLFWTAIDEACREGGCCFDFGRTSSAEQSVTSFKKHWGTEEVALRYQYYPRVPNSMALRTDGVRHRIASSLWRRLPLPVARMCSDLVFPHLG